MLNFAEAALLALVAMLSTNLDNLVLLLSWNGRGLRATRLGALVFFATMGVAAAAALALSFVVDYSALSVLAWVGLVPLAMGVWELLKRGAASAAAGSSAAAMPLMALALPLLANSGDTLAVQTVLFADLAGGYHIAGLVGSVLGALLLAAAGFIMNVRRGGGGGKSGLWLDRLARARPWLLIVIGFAILWDTDVDIV